MPDGPAPWCWADPALVANPRRDPASRIAGARRLADEPLLLLIPWPILVRMLGMGGMMNRSHLLTAAAILLLPAQTNAQTQKVSPPPVVYWISASTQTGFGMAGGAAPSASDMMRMATGGGGAGPMRMLDLDLGSKVPPAGPPAAAHAIPPSMAMGASLPLKTPKRVSGTAEKPDYEQPKGKLLLFWGCGETARPGQPIVIDFAKMAAGQVPPGLFAGEHVRIARAPSAANWPTHGHWPNDDKTSRQAIPGTASLIGAHKVSGNYTPDISFNLAQDWLQGVSMQQTPQASGAVRLNWNAVPGATAHFAQMMGGAEGSDGGANVVFWSSSDVQTFISGLSDYIAPAEAARLVGKKQLMPASQTSCAIPKEAIAAAEGGLISLVSHGPEVNIIHPPRPADPKIPWVQEWAMKARYVSRAGGIVGMDMGEAGTGSTATAPTGSKPKCKPKSGTDVAGAVAGALTGGMFGRKKQPDCEE